MEVFLLEVTIFTKEIKLFIAGKLAKKDIKITC